MTLNLAGFYQKFRNFPFSVTRPTFAVYTPVGGVQPAGSVVSTARPGYYVALQQNAGVNLAAGVPAKVYGGELEWSFAPNDFINMSAGASYAKSKITNGAIPCNDYILPGGGVGSDGIPDTTTAGVTAAVIDQATNGQGVGQCTVNGVPASSTPKWSGYFQSEGRIPVTNKADAFLRGLVSWYGNSKNDFTNPLDDVKNYALLNLYLGVRGKDGAWEISAYAKNLTNTFRVLARSQTSVALPGPAVAGQPAYTGYRSVAITDPREFGLTLRAAFGGH
jgi:iron complex outermembrane receptor protein